MDVVAGYVLWYGEMFDVELCSLWFLLLALYVAMLEVDVYEV